MCGRCIWLGQVCTLGRAPRTKETLPDFREWCRVTRHSRVFRGLMGCQRTPRKWGVTPTRTYHNFLIFECAVLSLDLANIFFMSLYSSINETNKPYRKTIPNLYFCNYKIQKSQVSQHLLQYKEITNIAT